MIGTRIRLREAGDHSTNQIWQSDKTLIVGRHPRSSVFLDENSVSRRHAELQSVDGGWILRDLGSSNGTFVNGQSVVHSEKKLEPGDVLQFGEAMVIVDSITEVANDAPLSEDLNLLESLTLRHQRNSLEESHTPNGLSNKQLQFLLRTGRAFDHSSTFQEYLSSLCWDVAEYFEAENIAIFSLVKSLKRLAVEESLCVSGTFEPTRMAESPMLRRVFEEHSAVRGFEKERGASFLCAPLSHGTDKGSRVIYLARVNKPFQAEDLRMLTWMAPELSVSLHHIQSAYDNQKSSLINLLDALVKIASWHDESAWKRIQRVRELSILLAGELGLPEAECHALKLGVSLYDFGMIGIQHHSLSHQGTHKAPASDAYKDHVIKGVEALESIANLAPILPIIRHHHERWDGGGYPDGLKGTDIPLLARIVAIADALAAMLEKPADRPAMPLDQALGELKNNRGTQFDPACVDAFIRLRSKILPALDEIGTLEFTISAFRFKKSIAKDIKTMKAN